MASTPREVCKAIRLFFKSISPGSVKVPMGLLDTILPAIGKHLSGSGGSFKIEAQRKAWGNVRLKGMLLRYDFKADILYSVTLNTCWSRFIICKEAAHLLIDTKDKDFTHDPVELVQRLITGAPSLNPDDPLRSEKLALIAAIELLVPWQIRSEIDRNLPDRRIAELVSVPQHIVNYLFRSKYWNVSEECHAEID